MSYQTLKEPLSLAILDIQLELHGKSLNCHHFGVKFMYYTYTQTYIFTYAYIKSELALFHT